MGIVNGEGGSGCIVAEVSGRKDGGYTTTMRNTITGDVVVKTEPRGMRTIYERLAAGLRKYFS